MTEQTTTTGQPDPAAGQNTPDNPEPLEQGASNGPGEGEGTDESPNGSEAARWRRRLRDTEAALGQLTERLTALQRAEVERIAGEHLADGSDVWKHDGVELPSLLSEDGTVSSDKVAELARAAVAARPHWAAHRPSPVPGKPRERLRGGGDPSDEPSSPSWANVIGKR